MNAPPMDLNVARPLIQALVKQREAASNAAAEFEAQNFVLAAENLTLKKELEGLRASPTAIASTAKKG